MERTEQGGPAGEPTVGIDALLDSDGGDASFRRLVADLLSISDRMAVLRSEFGRSLGITAAQYSMVMALRRLDPACNGMTVGSLAAALRVTSAFVAVESMKLTGLGLVDRSANPADKRSVLVSLTPHGRSAVDRIADQVREANDGFFAGLTREDFLAFTKIASRLAANTLDRSEASSCDSAA